MNSFNQNTNYSNYSGQSSDMYNPYMDPNFMMMMQQAMMSGQMDMSNMDMGQMQQLFGNVDPNMYGMTGNTQQSTGEQDFSSSNLYLNNENTGYSNNNNNNNGNYQN
jgi:hypothetical protein